MTPALVLKALGPWMALIFSTAAEAKVDPYTLGAIVYLESRGQAHIVSKERNGSCSVGLGQVNVPDCAPERISALRAPAYNLRVSAQILRANERWCRKHRKDRRCRSGNRLWKGGGAVNCYAGNTTRYAPRVAKVRRLFRKARRKYRRGS